MPKPILGVDVDQTVVNSAVHWWAWLEHHARKNLKYEEVSHLYSFGQLYVDALPEGFNPESFWRERDLYDGMFPIPRSVKVLTALSSVYDIVFISQIEGDHYESKHRFLRKFFPFMAGYMGTRDKHLIKVAAMIDDRNAVLNRFHERQPGATLIRFNTPHDQNEELCSKLIETVKYWDEVAAILL